MRKPEAARRFLGRLSDDGMADQVNQGRSATSREDVPDPEAGRPVRLDWARDYRGHRTVVYGHTPVHTPEWRRNTLNIDTGCVYGGALTALRYPEMELVSVPSIRTYYHKPGFADARPD